MHRHSSKEAVIDPVFLTYDDSWLYSKWKEDPELETTYERRQANTYFAALTPEQVETLYQSRRPKSKKAI